MKEAKSKKVSKENESAAVGLSGSFVFPNGDKYEGEYKNAEGSIQRSGTGRYVTVTGTHYEGGWDQDKMNGNGRLEFPSGAVYEGDFINNKFNGNGKYTWPNGSCYVGLFSENKLEGKGEFTDTDNQIWSGSFLYKAAPGLRFKLVK